MQFPDALLELRDAPVLELGGAGKVALALGLFEILPQLLKLGVGHAHGVERLVRNDLWKGRGQDGFYNALQWLYGWNADNCLAA